MTRKSLMSAVAVLFVLLAISLIIHSVYKMKGRKESVRKIVSQQTENLPEIEESAAAMEPGGNVLQALERLLVDEDLPEPADSMLWDAGNGIAYCGFQVFDIDSDYYVAGIVINDSDRILKADDILSVVEDRRGTSLILRSAPLEFEDLEPGEIMSVVQQIREPMPGVGGVKFVRLELSE